MAKQRTPEQKPHQVAPSIVTIAIGAIVIIALVGLLNQFDLTNLGTAPATAEPIEATSEAVAATQATPTVTQTIEIPLVAVSRPEQYTYTVINRYPHDPNAFTQGLIWQDGWLYEGTGLRGRSSLRRVDLQTGEVQQQINLDSQYFGEGVTMFGDRIIQLTWQAREGFVYNRETFERLETFEYPTEGWGLTHDGTRLIMSDGTSNLYFRDPQTFEEIGRVEVTSEGTPVVRLNELEYINGEVFANVWQTDRIARIDPDTGVVRGWIDLTGLLRAEDNPTNAPVDVLNGIAYDATNNRLFVTGKLWPRLYEIELVKVE